MTKHQLRIGNKVKVFGKIYTIKELGEYEAAMEETHGVFVYSDVQGVELTGEVLEACGFDKKQFVYQDGGTAEAFVNGRFVIRYIDEVKGYCCEWFPYPQSQNVLPGTMNYLHQLQNSYFWWTDGTELTINLEQVKV